MVVTPQVNEILLRNYKGTQISQTPLLPSTRIVVEENLKYYRTQRKLNEPNQLDFQDNKLQIGHDIQYSLIYDFCWMCLIQNGLFQLVSGCPQLPAVQSDMDCPFIFVEY